MSDLHIAISSFVRHTRHWLPSPQTVAEAAAAAGEPTPLLARDAFKRGAGRSGQRSGMGLGGRSA